MNGEIGDMNSKMHQLTMKRTGELDFLHAGSGHSATHLMGDLADIKGTMYKAVVLLGSQS